MKVRVKGEGRVKWSGVGAWYGTVNGRTGEGEVRGEENIVEWNEYGMVGYGKREDMGGGRGG